MNKYNVHIDPELPSKEETKSFQDFDSIINDVQNVHRPDYIIKNAHKNFRIVKVLILIAVVLMTLYFSHKYNQKKTKTEKNKKEVSVSGVARYYLIY